MEGTMKYLYVIDYWVPEYTGVINLIASTDKEAFEVISNKKTIDHVGHYYSEIKHDYEYNDNFKRSVCRNIIKAQRFPLLHSYPGAKEFHSGIVYFISIKNN
jgi:hypothetical protein